MIAQSVKRAFEAGIPADRLRAFFAEALICPVLTAHPTEVRRKSSLNRELDLAHLLAAREHSRMTPDEEAACDEAMRRALTPAVYADAAYEVLTRPSRECTGNTFLCEDVLVESGVTDLSRYVADPNYDGSDLGVDLFVDEVNPPGLR